MAGKRGEESSEWEAEPGAWDPSRQSQVKAPSLSPFFFFTRLEAVVLTERIRAGAERRGCGCCSMHRLRGAARNPSDPLPGDPVQISGYSPYYFSGLRFSPLFTILRGDLPWPTLSRAARTQPPPQVLCTRAALVHLEAAVVGIPRNHRLPSTPVSKPWHKYGCSALLPGLFPGPSPRPAPNGSSSCLHSQT